MRAASGAAERMFEILATKPAIARAGASASRCRSRSRGEVAFEDVRFAYPSRPRAVVLDGLSFTVRPGEKVAIVGPSGAGKSTIFHLLLRFYDPPPGDRVRRRAPRRCRPDRPAPAHRARPAGHRRSSPRPCARTSASAGRRRSDAEIERAAATAHAIAFIRRLPQGYDTAVGERGVTLSGGQRQRIAIARAVLREAPLLLLDEATSALDAESETLVQAALDALMAGRTTLVIAHRLATVLNCDRILVMDHGRIVEEGTHERLALRAGGLYARLAKLQFEAV